MGTILTAPFLPSEPLYRWREFLADHATPAGTSVGYDVSFGGGPWMPVAHGQDLAAYPLESVRVRSTLATGDTLATPSIASFTIRYEVLGPLTAVLVSPTNVTIAWGDAVNFTANAHDPWGHALPLACLWTTSDPMGTVAGDGTATATYVSGGVGIWSVRCESADHAANGTATVTVEANRLGRIDVTPSNATIRTDETLPFTANAYDTRGHPVLASPTWSATGGAIDEDGVYTPGPPGSFGILATTDGIVGRANVTVVLGQLARIDVTPASTTITADESLQFTANGFDMRDNDVVIAPMWSATCGSVNMTGWYAPRDVGSCTVYANATGISGSGRVAVLAGALARLAIAPTNATITADDVLTFTATGYDGNGNAVPVTPTWDAEQGAIDGAGLYEPTFAGVWSVSARAGGLNASTRVTVLPGALARLAVSPGDVDLSADETLQFTATGYDRAGNPVPIAPFWEAQDGTISGGAYVPHHTGVWSVNASQALIVGTALVHVRPGAIARIMVSPTASNMKEGDQVAFTAIAYDVKGNEVPGGNVAWRVDGDVGTIDAEGLFRATRAGHGLVVA
ncbi:MAG TPA: hypothetical protein VEM95_06275, partial [Thermoplasmata archaeon]|nr:hypothetical protein [Thermoplasmata archaeon]